MSDIVERLRARKATWQDAIAVMELAANEIERLRAALQEIADDRAYPGFGEELQCVAREALGEKS